MTKKLLKAFTKKYGAEKAKKMQEILNPAKVDYKKELADKEKLLQENAAKIAELNKQLANLQEDAEIVDIISKDTDIDNKNKEIEDETTETDILDIIDGVE